MGYKRPLNKRQSYLLGILWLVFATIFLSSVRVTLLSLIVLGFSAFLVFYPMWKSDKEQGTSNRRL